MSSHDHAVYSPDQSCNAVFEALFHEVLCFRFTFPCYMYLKGVATQPHVSHVIFDEAEQSTDTFPLYVLCDWSVTES